MTWTPPSPSTVFGLALTLMLASVPLRGHDEPEDAVLWLAPGSAGEIDAWLGVPPLPAGSTDAKAVIARLRQAFEAVIGCEVPEDRIWRNDMGIALSAWCPDNSVLQRAGWGVRASFDLAPLHDPLEELAAAGLIIDLQTPFAATTEVRGPDADPDSGKARLSLAALSRSDLANIDLRYALRVWDLAFYLGLLALLAAFEMALAWKMREVALRGSEDPHESGEQQGPEDQSSFEGPRLAAWFRFRFATTNLHAVFFILWLAVPSLAHGEAKVRLVLGLGGWHFWTLFLGSHAVLYAAASTLAVRLGHKVWRQLDGAGIGGVEPTESAAADLVRRHLLLLGTLLLPALCFFIGARALADGASRAGAFFFLATFFTFVVLLTRLAQVMGWVPRELAPGELRDAIENLAVSVGVTLKKVQILPGLRSRLANAGAGVRGIVLTEYLVRHLDRREVLAVVGHELVHVRRREAPKRVLLLLLVCVAAAVTSVISAMVTVRLVLDMDILHVGPYWLPYLFWGMVAFAGILAIPPLMYLMRRDELRTDVESLELTGDPEALIHALVRATRLNLLPLRFRSWQEFIISHPSTEKRVQTIARAAKLDEARVRELLSEPLPRIDPFPMPGDAPTAGAVGEGVAVTTEDHVSPPEEDLVWNQRTRLMSVARISLSRLALTASLGLGLVAAARALDLAAAGLGLTVAVALAVHLADVALSNVSSLWGYAAARRDLAARFAKRGFEPDSSGFFVGLSPSATSQIYDTHLDWDVGFLVLEPSRLVYLGDRVVFAVPREDVDGLALGPNTDGWLRVPRLYLRWRDTAGVPDAERITAVSFSTPERSLRQTGHGTRQLAERLRVWHEEDVAVEKRDAFAALPRPALEPVASRPQAETIAVVGAVVGAIFAFSLICLAAAAVGLSFDNGDAWCAAAAMALSSLFAYVPLFRGRRAMADWSFEA